MLTAAKPCGARLQACRVDIRVDVLSDIDMLPQLDVLLFLTGFPGLAAGSGAAFAGSAF